MPSALWSGSVGERVCCSPVLRRNWAVQYRQFIVRRGGLPPARRQRSQQALSLAEREEISRGLGADESMRSIAGRLSRAPSSISREIRRHGGSKRYRALAADDAAWDNAR